MHHKLPVNVTKLHQFLNINPALHYYSKIPTGYAAYTFYEIQLTKHT